MVSLLVELNDLLQMKRQMQHLFQIERFVLALFQENNNGVSE